MPTSENRAREHLKNVLAGLSPEEISRRLAPRPAPLAKRFPAGSATDAESVAKRHAALPLARESAANQLVDAWTEARAEAFARNIENFIGTVKVPVGIAGPLRVNGGAAQADYFVPLATTEAALVASYHRGANVITAAGGCAAMVLNEGVVRAPGFAFRTILEAGTFVQWCLAQREECIAIVAQQSRHAQLVDVRYLIEGNHVYVAFEFRTGDASGQNMVTIATQAICEHLLARAPVKPQYHFVEANLSGDKKASLQSFMSVRGKKVTAEVVLPAELVSKKLHTTPARFVDYWRMSALGGVMSGTIGVQGHYANGLAALFLATGQDVACIAEAAVGVTRFEVNHDGALYAAVTLPNLIVGTVGGGTGLPSQRACLELLGLAGTGHARAFAEMAAALALAGELSIVAALCADEFTRAHAKLARGKRTAGAVSAVAAAAKNPASPKGGASA